MTNIEFFCVNNTVSNIKFPTSTSVLIPNLAFFFPMVRMRFHIHFLFGEKIFLRIWFLKPNFKSIFFYDNEHKHDQNWGEKYNFDFNI